MSELPENNNDMQRLPSRRSKWLIPFLVFDALLITAAVAWVINKPSSPVENRPEVVATPLTEATPAFESQRFELFVPNDDARLSRKTVTDEKTSTGAPYGKKAARALELLFPQIEFLPTGLKIVSEPIKDKNGVVHVNLSKEFLKLNTAHETPVMLTLDAIARTLGALNGGGGKVSPPAKVLFLVEGKTVPTLSEFSLEEPWTVSETESEPTAKNRDAEDAV